MGVTAPPLVGREEELRVIERAFDMVGAGRSRAIGVAGEPGIGKSRLLAEMAARASERGHLAVGGRAAELERDVPFSLWVEALDEEVARGGEELLAGVGAERLADLGVALPAVARVAGVEPAAAGERHRVARAVRALLEQLAAARPLSVLLDDVQWADPASAEVIGLLLHRLPEGGVLLALGARTGRAPVLEDAWHAAARHGTADVLELRALSRDAVDSLLGQGVGPAARARLYRESGGNPFFLQALAGAGETATARDQPALGALGVPRSVMMALAGEIGALDDGARLFVQGAAVAGDPFETSMAAAAADMPTDGALEALDAVLAADLVRTTDEPSRFGFRHPLVRRAVYQAAGGGWNWPRTHGPRRSWRQVARASRSGRIMWRARRTRATLPPSRCWQRPAARRRATPRRRPPAGTGPLCACCPRPPTTPPGAWRCCKLRARRWPRPGARSRRVTSSGDCSR